MDAVETNVLIYAHDVRDPQKQTTASSLIESQTEGVLLWQVSCEYLAASRKLESQGYGAEQAGYSRPSVRLDNHLADLECT